jgi:hypothetical protein
VTSRKVKGSLASAPTTGLYVLRVGAEEGPGRIKVKVKARAPEGDDEIDIRVTPEATNLLGTYVGGVLDLAGSAEAEVGLLTGGILFDGTGGFTHAMERLSIVEDETAPAGYRLEREIPGGAVPGLYTLLDGVATLDFDPASGLDRTAAMDVLLGGDLLLPRPEAGAGAGTGFLARRSGVDGRSDLDGDYLYLFVEQSIVGSGDAAEVALDLELGLLQLDGAGSILGGGLRMRLVLDPSEENGFRTESSEAVLAFGSYSVGDDAEVTFSIRRQLFGGDTETHVLTGLRDGDLLYSGGVDDEDRIHAAFMIRQGSDATTADAAGTYRHYGSRSSATGGVRTTTIRSGSLTLDGTGGFSGVENVSETVTEEDEDPVVTDLGPMAVSGTYEIRPFDLTSLLASLVGGGTPDLESLELPLTLRFAGEGEVTGIVMTDADLLLAFGLEGGLGFDVLVRE